MKLLFQPLNIKSKLYQLDLLIKHVSTSSSLVTTFNSRPNVRLNLNFKKNAGLFGYSELQTYDGFYLMKENVKRQTEDLISEACNPKRNRKLVNIFDELSDTLCKVADLAEFIRLGHPQTNFSNSAEDACINISGIVESLNTNRRLYDSLKKVYEEGDRFSMDEMDRHIASLFLFDFEQSGIHLDEEKRRKVVGLNNYILQMGQRFMAGALEARSVPSSSIPLHIREHFRQEGGFIHVPSLHADSPDESVREAAYKLFLLPDGNQQYLLSELLQSRQELAHLCGFPNFAHRALKMSLAGSPDMVRDFLDEVDSLLRPKVEKEFANLLLMKQQLNQDSKTLYPWDVPYFSNKFKRMHSEIRPKDYMPYLSLGTCMEGLSGLMKSLYNISLVSDPIEHGEVWSNDIYKLAVIHHEEGLLGHIYCDFFERAGKPNQDCHFTIRCGRMLPDGSYQTPVVVVMLNLASPGWNTPTLLTPSILDNLFHEMGHAMHSMLGRTKYQHVSGTRCSTDLAEVPSILMEYFASDPRVISSFASHYATGKPMPQEMIHKLCSSKHLLAASDTHLQLFYSVLDQDLHSGIFKSPNEILKEAQNKYYPLPHVPGTAWELRFSHLVGYGAKYYSYLMSRAVASWLWQRCFRKDPFSRDAGESYRRGILGHGGSKPGTCLVSDFLNVEVTPSALAEALVASLEQPSE